MSIKKILPILFLLVLVLAVSHVAAEETPDEISSTDVSEKVSVDETVDEIGQSEDAVIANESGPITGNESTEPVENSTEPVVEKTSATLKASKLTAGYKKSTKWSIKLTDSKNNPVAGKKITLKIYTGSKYKTVKVKTNGKGIATYNTKNLKAGTHKVKVSLDDAMYDCKAISSSIKVVKQTKIKFYVVKDVMKEGSILSIFAVNKKTKKFINGVKLKLLIYTGKKYKTINLKTKKLYGAKGAAAYGTNAFSAGNHKVKILPVQFKYVGSKTTSLKIKKSAKKYPTWSTKV